MGTLWFCLIAFMIVMFVLLDGFDLGAGIVYFLVAKTDQERREVLASIGPVWNGNEVLLIAAGGTLFCAFPRLYASSFSGFYLPLMIVLWLLILRGAALELRNEMRNPVWTPFWDFLFSLSCLLLVVFFGVAFGNVVRGVPIDATGYFFEALWTDFRVGSVTGILDWYTGLVGVLALASLSMHGALWLQMKTLNGVRERARIISGYSWWVVVALGIIVTVASCRIQPSILENFRQHPWGFLFAVFAIMGVAGAKLALARNREFRAFLSSAIYLGGMMACAVFGIYPRVLPARDPAFSLTIQNTQAGSHGLHVGFIWWVIGMALAGAYLVFVYRFSVGKVELETETYH